MRAGYRNLSGIRKLVYNPASDAALMHALLAQSMESRMRTFVPSKLEVESVTLWLNRPFEEWHRPLNNPRDMVIGGKCHDANCPVSHVDEDVDVLDPAALPALTELQPAMRLLVLLNYCGHWHVSYQTLASIRRDHGPRQIYFKEKSRDTYFYRPAPDTYPWSVGLYWGSVRYLAVVQSDAPAFGKYGGKACFVRELARVSGLTPREIRAAMQELEALNPPPSLLLRPVSPWPQWLHKAQCEQNSEALVRYLTALAPTNRTPDIANYILVATQRGEASKMERHIAGWQPPDPEKLAEALSRQLKWLLHYVPEDRAKVPHWWATWSRLFGLDPAVPAELITPSTPA